MPANDPSVTRPKVSASRIMLGVRFGRIKDRQCATRGHKPDPTVSAQMLSGAYWPVCAHCGRAVKPDDSAR